MFEESSNPFAALAALRPAVRLTSPPAWFFKLPPAPLPRTLPPPPNHPTLAHPFTIPTNLYNAALDSKVPITIALVYVTVITYLNSVNKSRNYKPWAFSKTSLFKLLVITHNIILAVYSAWTFVGMFNALRISIYNPYHEFGVAGTVDSFCKINGPRGIGSAATYNATSSTYSIANRFFHLGADGLTPETTDVGRLWNEGLAFYGWLFYLSKYYEVIDTLIIIAKGKKSSFLQTYHHAGAMICMWAGIRYMSPPIWMFVFVNSFIHSIMYSFYLCSAIGVRVPVWFKRSLTTLQITQFVVGVFYAFIHLFIKYQSPISIPYTYHLGSVASSIIPDASTVISTATASASANIGAHIKKALLRAAGREGLAENVMNDRGQTFGIDAVKAAEDLIHRTETRYRNDLQWVHCLDTSGQAFAVYLNVLYLAPLTWLFVRFFMRSYLGRLERRRSSTAAERAHEVAESFADARRGVDRRLSQAFEDVQGGLDDTDNEFAIVDNEEFQDQVKDAAAKSKQVAKSAAQNVTQKLQAAKEEASPVIENVKKQSKSAARNASRSINSLKDDAKSALAESTKGMDKTFNNVKQQADSVKARTEELSKNGLEKAEAISEDTAASVKKSMDQVTREGVWDGTRTEEVLDSVKNTASEVIQSGTEAARNSAEAAATSVKNALDSAANAIRPVESKAKSDKKSADSSNEPKNRSQGENASGEKSVARSTGQKADRADDVSNSGEREDTSNTGDGEDSEHQGSKEKVHNSIVNQKTSAETDVGDKTKSPGTTNTPSQNTKSKNVSSPRKPNQKGANKQDTSNKNVSNKEDSPQKSHPKEDVTADQDDHEGRQASFHGDRENALEKLSSANTEGSDQIIPEGDEQPAEDDNNTEQQSPSKKKKKRSGRKSKGEASKPSFDDTRSEALERLESANSQNAEQDRLAESETNTSKSGNVTETKKKASGDKNQQIEDQKESWIHVDDDDADKPSFAEVAKSATDGKHEESGNQERSESLTATADTPSKQSAAEQDKIIDESEPLRDDVSSQPNTGA